MWRCSIKCQSLSLSTTATPFCSDCCETADNNDRLETECDSQDAGVACALMGPLQAAWDLFFGNTMTVAEAIKQAKEKAEEESGVEDYLPVMPIFLVLLTIKCILYMRRRYDTYEELK